MHPADQDVPQAAGVQRAMAAERAHLIQPGYRPGS